MNVTSVFYFWDSHLENKMARAMNESYIDEVGNLVLWKTETGYRMQEKD